ncbi:AbrB/MazE/SpoVT family DNA-binding domain-containing protein [Clostridium sp.]|uniref:AbrB/MazE/SpoVT family DNA-binding domain-containing protein n=1 Tax=Clostridium sp. TaxID=1506 RepID=UPI003463EE61
MKAIGVVRRVDPLGRIVLPVEIRRTLGIEENETNMEIYIEGEIILLKKYEPCCIFCGEARGVGLFKGKKICKKCLGEMK